MPDGLAASRDTPHLRGMSKDDKSLTTHKSGTDVSSNDDISSFLAAASTIRTTKAGRGGLIFALDATMSRQSTWDRAQHLQSEMFDAVASTGGLDVQLAYFRGFGECRASRWVGNASALRKLMTGIDCQGGQTQIGKVFAHTRREATKRNPLDPSRSRVDALVYVGDAMEEDVDELCAKAGEIGLLGVPCFFFQEGGDPGTERAFREFARLTKGAYAQFGPASAARLAELLKAVARYAAGGRAALEKSAGAEDRALLEQLR
ncbi:VWA domain-containing protein [Rhizobiaceae bacterium]|nr:VWA domain-containing protein [Rhizobiaceae bacterium]